MLLPAAGTMSFRTTTTILELNGISFPFLSTTCHLKSMSLADLCFFYHSGPKARRVVGVVSVVREWYNGAVDVKAVGEMRRPVDLKEMKQHFKDFVLFKQPRLSVVPVPELIWKNICDLGAGYHGDDDDEHSRPID